MVYPKKKGGLSSNSFYPSKHGEPKKQAISWEERKEATLETHNIWTDHPPGDENCFFTQIISDEVGPCDIEFNTNKFNDASFRKYIDIHDSIDDDIKTRVIKAHNTLSEFIETIENQAPTLKYPYSYDLNGKFSKPEIREIIKKTVLLGRGKARTDGFTLGVLGRLPAIFTEIFMLKTELHLTLRLIDRNKQNSLRVCIPKGDGSVRPITVASDDLCITNHLVRLELHKDLEKSGVLPENLISFRKGRSCSDATITDNIIKELSLQENESYVAIISEDIEKMYDRIHIDLQGLILKHAGADEGYVSWQLDNMHNRTNTLVTDIFQENIQYNCGLPQGINLSVELSNLYSTLYMKWLETAVDKLPNLKGYRLDINGIIHLIKNLGYVDDTTIYLVAKKLDISLDEFVKLVQAILDTAADFSLVFKVGRNPKKCSVTLYNIEENKNIPDFQSIAWSFENRGPLKAFIKPVIVRCTTEGDLIKYTDKGIFTESEILDSLKYNRYLGVSKNSFQENTDQIDALCKKMKERICKIADRTNHPEEIRQVHNSIVGGTAAYSPLCIQFPLKKAIEMDKFITKVYSKSMGYCPSDTKHAIFISKNNGGHDVKLFTCEFICGLIREMEVNLCSNRPHGVALRMSIQAAREISKSKEDINDSSRNINLKRSAEETETVKAYHINLMGNAMRLTSAFGIYLRDLKDELSARICNELVELDTTIQVIGGRGHENRGNKGAVIDACNKNGHKAHDYNLDGRIHIFFDQAIQSAKNMALTKGINGEILINKFVKEKIQEKSFLLDDDLHLGYNIVKKKSVGTFRRAIKSATEKLNNDYALGGLLGVYEWRKPVNDNIKSHENSQEYTLITSPEKAYTPLVTLSMRENSLKLLEQMRKNFNLDEINNDQIMRKNVLRISDYEIISRATVGFTRPLFIATDGSYDPETKIARASMVIVEPEIYDHDQSDEWTCREATPLLIRTFEVPRSYGLEDSTINTAEVLGLILASLTIPQLISSIIITDSNVAKATLIRCVNFQDFTPRELIRKVGHQISSYLTNLMIASTEDWSNTLNIDMIEWANSALETWSTQQEEIQSQQRRTKFNKDMWTKLGRNYIMKIYSHQDKDQESCPNKFCTSANEIADMAADITKKIDLSWKKERHIYIPPFSNEFIFTLDGKSADKGASKLFRERQDKELLYRVRARGKQGSWFRVMEQSGIKFNHIGEKGTHKNIVRGTASSWNRTVYMNNLLTDDIQRINTGVSPVPNWKEDIDLSCKVKQCPFCDKEVSGSLEHLHMACENETLLELRSCFHKDMEEYLRLLYEKEESLQVKIENAARDAEVEARYIIERENRKNNVIQTPRLFNKSVLVSEEIETLIASNNTPEYLKRSLEQFPLAHKAGLISGLEESKLDLKEATITDLSYQGILPKAVVRLLLRSEDTKTAKNLIAIFILRSICLQRAITWLVKNHQETIKMNEIILTSTKENVRPRLEYRDNTKKGDIEINRVKKLENLFLQANWDNDFHKELWKCRLTGEVRILLNQKLTLPKNDENILSQICCSLGLRARSPCVNEDKRLTNSEMKDFNKCKVTCKCGADTQPHQSNYGVRSFCNTCKLVLIKDKTDLNCAGCGKREEQKLCLHCIRSNFVFRKRISEKLEVKKDEQNRRDFRTFRARDREVEENEQKRRRFS